MIHFNSNSFDNACSTNDVKYLVLSQIADNNPDWVSTDGSCPKCVDFYNELESVASIANSIRIY